MEADLEPAGDGQPGRGARFWPPAWSFADCDVFAVAVTGKGCHDLFPECLLALLFALADCDYYRQLPTARL